MPQRTPTHRRPVPRAADLRAYSAQRGYDRRWRVLRKWVLNHEPLCRVCGTSAVEVDHIIPLRDGGTNESGNLQPLCRSCHVKKTKAERAARAAGQASPAPPMGVGSLAPQAVDVSGWVVLESDAAVWFNEATGERRSTVATGRILNQAVCGGRIRLQHNPSRNIDGLGYVWRGPDCDRHVLVTYDLSKRISARRF